MHRTLRIGTVWLLVTLKAVRSVRLAELLWRVALFGAPLTATLVVALAIEPPIGSVALPQPIASIARPAAVVPPRAPILEPPPSAAPGSEVSIPDLPRREIEDAAASEPAGPPIDGRPWILAALAAGSLFGLAHFALLRVRLHRLLRDRRRLESAPWPEVARRLGRTAGLRPRVRLT